MEDIGSVSCLAGSKCGRQIPEGYGFGVENQTRPFEAIEGMHRPFRPSVVAEKETAISIAPWRKGLSERGGKRGVDRIQAARQPSRSG
jgi:hypothetical protein